MASAAKNKESGASVVRDLVIGNKLGLGGGFWNFIDALNENFGALGYLIIGIFLVCWLASVVVYRLKRFDDMEVLAAERR